MGSDGKLWRGFLKQLETQDFCRCRFFVTEVGSCASSTRADGQGISLTKGGSGRDFLGIAAEIPHAVPTEPGSYPIEYDKPFSLGMTGVIRPDAVR